jgi:hypothetical protein
MFNNFRVFSFNAHNAKYKYNRIVANVLKSALNARVEIPAIPEIERQKSRHFPPYKFFIGFIKIGKVA